MAQAAASSVNKEMETSMERLSTGKRINGASDDAAGVAIVSRSSAEITGTNQAIRNAMDGQALINTAEGTHAEVENLLQRMRELAVQATNDTNSSADRAMLQQEMDNLIDGVDRISSTTTWAGTELLDGSASAVKLQIGSGTSNADQVSVAIGSLASTGTTMTHSGTTLGSYKSTAALVVNPTMTFALTANDDGADMITGGAQAEVGITYTQSTGIVDIYSLLANAAVTTENATLVITINTKTSVNVAIAAGSSAQAVAEKIADVFKADDTVVPGLTVDETNAAAGRVVLGSGSSASYGGLTSVATAQNVIDTVDGVLENLNAQRANLGALSNRLDSTVSNLTNISSNLQAGRGRIEDADFAAETTSLAKSQILQQASTAMLAQANASKQNVLSLLQG
jgi:flagellin